ncbi:MAG: CHC2 zinc finger domain-containing protein [Candidatus Hadarchaeales archaeon]
MTEPPRIFTGLQGFHRSGNGFFARCPFHDDRRPSLHISMVGGRWLWYCFGCGAGGDERDLARRLGRDIAQDEDHPSPTILATLEQARRRFREEGQEARLYLRARGISPETAERFQVGWLPGAIAIPMQNAPGSICGVKLRRLRGEPRYMSIRGSREGAVAPFERPSAALLIVEGAMDAMALDPWGQKLGLFIVAARDPKVVRALTIPRRVLIWMDEDEAGERFAERMMEAFGGIAIRVPKTGFKDPADLVRAAARGLAPDPEEILRPLLRPAVPAWLALWAAAAQRGWLEPPPIPVPEEEIQKASPALDLLGQELITKFILRKKEG